MSQNNEFSLDDFLEVGDDGSHMVSIKYLNIIIQKKNHNINICNIYS